MRGDAGRGVRQMPSAGTTWPLTGGLRLPRRPVPVLRLPRRPDGLVDQTRWLFTICFLVSLVVCTPHPLIEGGPVAMTMVTGAALTLTGTWVHRYRTGTAPPLLDVADALATACFAAACPLPSVALGFVFSSVWGQALYGSVTRLAISLVLTLTGLAASLPLWMVVPGHGDAVQASSVLGAFPVLTLTTIVARHLADGLFARERAQRREAGIARFGIQLLAATDRETVYEHAWDAVGTVCAASPGLVAAILRQGEGAATVLRRTSGLADLPAALPALGPGDTLVLPDPGAPGPLVRVDSDTLERAAGFRGGWKALAVPGSPGTVLLLGHPKTLPKDDLLAAQTMLNQLGLAVRNTDIRERLDHPGEHRSPHRSRQPEGLPHRARPGAARRDRDGGALSRPRRLQERQRRARARGRRRPPAARRLPPSRLHPAGGSVRPPRR